jgi:hypothetical protein
VPIHDNVSGEERFYRHFRKIGEMALRGLQRYGAIIRQKNVGRTF